MAAFAVIAVSAPEKLQQAVMQQYGASHYAFSSDTWFVSDVGTTKDVAEKLGLTGGRVGSVGVVIKIAGYSGWANAAAWQYLQNFPEAVSNG